MTIAEDAIKIVCIISIEVKCYAGYRGEETPRSNFFEDKEIQVEKVLDMWLAPDHRYFKCLGSDEDIYIIRHDIVENFWEMTFYKQNPPKR